MSLPKGHIVIEEFGETIIVGLTDYSLMFVECEPIIEYKGSEYAWGPLTVVPRDLIGTVAVAREYNKK